MAAMISRFGSAPPIRNFFETAPVIYGLSANSDSVNRVQILNQSLVIQVGSKHRIHETVLPLTPGACALGCLKWNVVIETVAARLVPGFRYRIAGCLAHISGKGVIGPAESRIALGAFGLCPVSDPATRPSGGERSGAKSVQRI